MSELSIVSLSAKIIQACEKSTHGGVACETTYVVTRPRRYPPEYPGPVPYVRPYPEYLIGHVKGRGLGLVHGFCMEHEQLRTRARSPASHTLHWVWLARLGP